MPSAVVCLLLSCSRVFPPPLPCHPAIHFTSPRRCSSTAGCSPPPPPPPSMTFTVVCLLLSYSRLFPPSLPCYRSILPYTSLHQGAVHPLQNGAHHQCLPLLSVYCCAVPGGSLLLCYGDRPKLKVSTCGG